MNKGLSVSKSAEIPQSTKFVFPCPKVWDFDKKRLYWASEVCAFHPSSLSQNKTNYFLKEHSYFHAPYRFKYSFRKYFPQCVSALSPSHRNRIKIWSTNLSPCPFLTRLVLISRDKRSQTMHCTSLPTNFISKILNKFAVIKNGLDQTILDN